MELWNPILPQWLRNNIINQLIIPRLKLEVDNWNPQTLEMYNKKNKNHVNNSNNTDMVLSESTINIPVSSPPLHTYLLPWLVVISEDKMHLHLFELVKNKWIVFLHDKPFMETESDGGQFILKNLSPWLEVFSKDDFSDILIQCVIPELVRHLRYNFHINPAKQDLTPLKEVLAWSTFVPELLMTQIIITEFFPKWYKILAMWLKSSPNVSYSEISEWYMSWKKVLKDVIGIDEYWKKGLDMMNQGENCQIPVIPYDSDSLLSHKKI